MLSTHDVDFAYRFAKRVIIFHKGKVIGDGAAGDIFKDEELLERANLTGPFLMQVCGMLRKKGILGDGGGKNQNPCVNWRIFCKYEVNTAARTPVAVLTYKKP